MAGASKKTIESYHAEIVLWRSQGVSLADISKKLNELGVAVDRNAVNRYCLKKAIPATSVAKPEAKLSGPASAKSTPEKPKPDISQVEKKQAETAVFITAPSRLTGGSGIGTGSMYLNERQASERPKSRQVRPPPTTASEGTTQPKPNTTDVRKGGTAETSIDVPDEASEPWEALMKISEHHEEVFERLWASMPIRQIKKEIETNSQLNLPLEDWQEYVELFLESKFPAGTVKHHLLEVIDGGSFWNSQDPVFSFGNADVLTTSDFFEGLAVFGAAGSGKTSGSGRNLGGSFLGAGWGGMVLTTKEGEAEEWIRLAALCGRANDVIVIRPGCMHRIDAIGYEIARNEDAVGMSEDLLNFFRNLASGMGTKKAQLSNAEFWQNTGDQLIRNLIDAHLAAQMPVTIPSIARFLLNAPGTLDGAEDDNWAARPVFGDVMIRARELAKTRDARQTFDRLREYWLHDYPQLNPETRSCVTIAFSAMIDALRNVEVEKLLGRQTSLSPNVIFSGCVVVIDLPINRYHEAGRLVQTAWKYLFQRAALNRRDFSRGDGMRPVFLWEDECHNFLIDYDPEFNRVARDRRVARVMLTQNINNLYDAYGGGDAARVKVDSLLGTLNIRIFHANGDLTTNKWASESIGTHEKVLRETSSSPARYGGWNPVEAKLYEFIKGPTTSVSTHTVREPLVHPHEFTTLVGGGPQNEMATQAVITQVGRIFSNGHRFMSVRFRQIILSERLSPSEISAFQQLQHNASLPPPRTRSEKPRRRTNRC